MPDGKYDVGVIRAEFVDGSRRLDASDPASGARRLPAIVWYPAAGRAVGGATYLEGDAAAVRVPAIARNFGYAVEDLHTLTTQRLNVRAGAAPARLSRGFPIVVFSHGFFLYPEQNSVLAVRLASHGYIVVSIAHPGDAADVRLEDGHIAATRLAGLGDDPRFAAALKALAGGTDLATSREALTSYAEAFPATRLGRSFAEWRDDTLAVAKAIVDGNEPRVLRDVLRAADRKRLAFAGMSFGGATSATTCKLVDACRAAVNLDGQNFDPELFDRPVGRPFLLLLSDWTRYSLFEGQPKAADFSPNDLAYESWSGAGQGHDVIRVRLEGIRHMGFTDLVALLDGPKRVERVGEINGDEALSAIGDLVLAFLDAQLRNGDAASIDRAIERHPELKRHVPARLKRWVSRE
jgi:predicted dienelactone hydrolase